MFSWAQKSRISERTSTSNHKNSNSQTDLFTHPSSPAHSSCSLQSTGKRNSSHEKIKSILTQNKIKNRKQQHIRKATNLHIHNLGTKTQLVNFINLKTAKNYLVPKNEPSFIQYQNQNNRSIQRRQSKQKIVKIKIQVNKLLSQYCRTLISYFQQKQKQSQQFKICWGIYAMSVILWKLGFIQNIVHDRHSVRQLWNNLNQPDYLGVYVFLEQALAGRVHVQLAASYMYAKLGEKLIINYLKNDLDIERAQQIISERTCSNLYSNLALNRLRRSKEHQN